MNLLSDDIQEQLQDFKSTVEALKSNANTLAGMLALPHQLQPAAIGGEQPQCITHLHRAEVMLALGQLTHTLHQMHMRASGLDPQKHFACDIHKENERLAAYKKKVSKAVAAHELYSSKPTVSLNISAANRFIDHAIPDLNPEQRRLLKEQSTAGKRKAEGLDGARVAKKGRGGSSSNGKGSGSKGGTKAGVGSVKDHAVSFINALLQEGVGGKPSMDKSKQNESIDDNKQ